jgi:GT2 family glycosyltransferase
VALTSIVVPIYDGSSHLPTFFDSLAFAMPSDSELILVDNGSTEPVFDFVPEMRAGCPITKMRLNTNVGYAGAVNRGIAEAKGDFIVQLNSDLILGTKTITEMIALLKSDDRAGVVGSKLVYPSTGKIQHAGMAFGEYSKRHLFLNMPACHPLCQKTRELQIVTGATVAATRATMKAIGPLDERFYMQSADLDYCMRARKVGLRNYLCAESEAYHWEGLSGAARHVQAETSDALFWSKWSRDIVIDLDHFVGEALDHARNEDPLLSDLRFTILDLSRGSDGLIVVNSLRDRWPGAEIRSYRQVSHAAAHIKLPLVLPHWTMLQPEPFIYLVDDHRELDDNFFWFDRRRRLVRRELIVDLNASVVVVSDDA